MVRLVLCLSIILLLGTSCERGSNAGSDQRSEPAKGTNQQIFHVRGTILKVRLSEKTVDIRHEEIPGYMPAMTMPFDVKNTNELAGLEVGDSVSFRMIVTDTEGWIDQIKKLATAGTNQVPTTGPLRMVRDVEPLEIGDRLPEYRFTNQLSQPISTSQFTNQVLAINFLFTRCPFPTFCPLTANNFAETQQKLSALMPTNGLTNWHLLTITIDPEFDTPLILKAYGERYQHDPARWTLATGSLIDITAIAEQLGQSFWRDETGSISHNMRAAVFDSGGRLRALLAGNSWKSDELVAEMLKAMKQ